MTVVIHLVEENVTVFKVLRKLVFIYSRLKQCSPCQKFMCADTSMASVAIMFDTDPLGVEESAWRS